MSLFWLTNSVLVYEPKCANEYCTAVHGAQINFRDLTPYLTYGFETPSANAHHRYRLTINVPLFKKLRANLRGQKGLGPLKMSLEMAHKVIVPQKKIRSQSFLSSGTLVILCI